MSPTTRKQEIKIIIVKTLNKINLDDQKYIYVFFFGVGVWLGVKLIRSLFERLVQIENI